MKAEEEKEIYRAAISIYSADLRHEAHYNSQDRAVLRFRAADEAQALFEHVKCMSQLDVPLPYTIDGKENALRAAVSKVGLRPSAIGHELGISRRAARTWLIKWYPDYEPEYEPGRSKAAVATE